MHLHGSKSFRNYIDLFHDA